MRLVLQAIAVICITTQVYGDERLALESRAAADESLRILGSGDRQGAIRLLLQALPEDPTSSDLELYPEAMEALWRVVAARIVVLEDDGRVLAATSPDGSRMLIADGSPEVNTLPVTLHDAQSGGLIAEIASAESAEVPPGLRADADLQFSPDGTYASVSLYGDGVIAIIDAETGERVSNIPSPDRRISLGFSDDGRLFATRSVTGLTVWETTSGRAVLERDYGLPDRHAAFVAHAPMGWLSDSTLLEGQAEVQGVLGMLSARIDRLVEVGPAGEELIEEALGIEVFSFAREAGRDEFVLSGPEGAVVISSEAGVRARMPGSPVPVFLTRGGEALVWPSNIGTGGIANLEIVVRDLDGNQIAPVPQDFGPFGALVVSPEGDILGISSLGELNSPRYRGDDVPLGADLYHLAVSLVPDAARSEPTVAGDGDMDATSDDATPDDTALDAMSRYFALQARRHLATGQREAAITASLKGLPADPEAGDFERFSDAHDALKRAVAARPVMLGRQDQAFYVVERRGSRGVVMQPRPGGQSFDARLVDAERGTILGPVSHPDFPDAGFDTLTTVFFSPDASRFLLLPESRDRLSIFRSDDGSFEKDLMIPDVEYDEFGRASMASGGFSPDGRLVAAGNSGRVMLFSSNTGAVVEQVSLPAGLISPSPVGWGNDGRLFIDGMEPDTFTTVIAIYRDGAMIDFIELPDGWGGLAGQSLWPSPHGSSMILTGETTSVLDPAGNLVMTVPGGGFAFWTRSGSAIATVTLSGDLAYDVSVFDLDGTEMPVRPEDYAPMDTAAFDAAGQRLSYGPPRITFDWGAEGIPDGRDLYDATWAELPDDLRRQINMDRIDLE